MEEHLTTGTEFFIRQRRELAELFGFETRNKYEISNASGAVVGFAAEQQKDLLGFLFRQVLGHWRRFQITIFDAERKPYLRANHPFRFFFQRMDVTDARGQSLGYLQQRFAVFYKSFDVYDPRGALLFQVRSPFWRLWTFSFLSQSRQVAIVQKKWSGLLREAFLDADSFRIAFMDERLHADHRNLILCASLFIDLQYFEKKA